MQSYLTIIVSALIGALIGSIGAVITSHFLSKKYQLEKDKEFITQKYLSQYQDSLESLWFRIHNIHKNDAKSVMSESYFNESTLYALGRVLAYERLMNFDGIYALLLKKYPKQGPINNTKIDLQLINMNFHQYDRILLADLVLKRLSNGDLKIKTYAEFLNEYNSNTHLPLETILKSIQNLSQKGNKMEELLLSIKTILVVLQKYTSINCSSQILNSDPV